MKKKKLLVTGGAGFIGSAFVRLFADKYDIIVADRLTYAGDIRRLKEVWDQITFKRVNIARKEKLRKVFQRQNIHTVVHFAAETHVDRSLKDIEPFVESNIFGTQHMLELAEHYNVKKFIHISTDEVYGDHKTGRFKETDPLKPRNPYSATKAAAEFLVRTAMQCSKMPIVIARPANNYGPFQYPEKFIPVAVTTLLKGGKIPVYGRGRQIREWLFVEDCARAVELLVRRGKRGEAYNIGTDYESTNLNTAKAIVKLLGKTQKSIKFVPDRPGHDFRYGVSCAKIHQLGWKPLVNFPKGLKSTIHWYQHTHLKN